MAWTDITAPVQGTTTKKTSFADAVIANLIYLYNLLGGAGAGANSSILNGSFEVDSDADGIGDEWEETLYPGGSSDLDAADPGHGAVALKITSPGGAGNGGGYYTSKSYTVCSASAPVALRFALKSSVAGVLNIVRLLWYDANKEACATPSTDIYSDAVANPTSWTEFVRGAAPPATARFFKVRLIGCDSSDATAGSCSFDGVELLSDQQISVSGAITEQSSTSLTFEDKSSLSVVLPPLSASSIVELSILAQIKAASGGSQRFRVGTQYSDALAATSATYIYQGFKLLLFGVSGAQTLYQQLLRVEGTTYGKVAAYNVVARIIQP